MVHPAATSGPSRCRAIETPPPPLAQKAIPAGIEGVLGGQQRHRGGAPAEAGARQGARRRPTGDRAVTLPPRRPHHRRRRDATAMPKPWKNNGPSRPILRCATTYWLEAWDAKARGATGQGMHRAVNSAVRPISRPRHRPSRQCSTSSSRRSRPPCRPSSTRRCASRTNKGGGHG